MTVNAPETHPIVNVALVLVDAEEDDVTRNSTVSQELTAPVTVVKGPLLMLYSPPMMESAVCPVIPETVIGLDTYRVESVAPVTPEKLNASGITSAGTANAKRDN